MKTHVSFGDDDLLYSKQFDDHYYSRNDGRAECAHVFLEGNNLPARWVNTEKFVIGELGFGTGLNFLETWRQWRAIRKEGQHLNFVSLEGFRLEKDIARRALARWPEIADLADILLSKWDHLELENELDNQTKLHVHMGEAVEQLPKFPKIDAWFLDGFAPAKNPDMWSLELMKHMAGRTSADGTFASYTAAGWVRQNLQLAGFDVQRRPGFGKKRHMICGHLSVVSP